MPDAAGAGDVQYTAYVMEVRLQASAFKVAYDRLLEACTRRRAAGERLRAIRETGGPLPLRAEQEEYAELAKEMVNEAPRILEALQSLLVAAGIISSILWPDPRGRRHATEAVLEARTRRGEYLRRVLDPSPESPLLRLRSRATDPRGGLVHYDEMLEEFIGAGSEGLVVTFQIGSLGHLDGSWRPGDTVRWFDDERRIVHVNGRELGVDVLLEEIRRIASHIQVTGREDLVRGVSPPGNRSLAMGFEVDRT